MSEIVMQPMRWSELPHVDDVKPMDDGDSELMDELRQVLMKHDALDRFGVFLLHNHFDMSDDEFLMETTDEDARTQKISVSSGIAPDENAIQTMWKFDENGIGRGTVCVLRCHYFLGHKQRHKIESR
jgi:hypothetical protein